ncbi:2,3-diphosphoglycerate-dependent phosphoglycerate mutase GpmB [Candidatus Fukatsuia symbiotica]|uniref:Phosphoglycerate mutase n=1 Tax=Candidatus Fukatsuia symbiotica TaxID=1878942 RepID=A0A2U8I3W9_9GAMM|nr:2,3-diphosphoglycerate-dependent phosphoglycerate mutase GpmB [Candidatus Fukatsuia symbiotica]AWK13836.1 phosphoglycerate mutase [Candidatus Fukatsuia symbiotica]MEA9446039.1 2,3-diphosphoglycerate-dependent phosphoglycerate mutase GpmB [Candidatus Fukatsuia symbiotica]
MLQVYLVRHGETEFNTDGRIQGCSDSPLTIQGKNQINSVAERVRSEGITHVISSDLGRTKQTAEIIANICRCELSFDSRLRELRMGELEGCKIDSLTKEQESWRRHMVDGTVDARVPGGGESMAELASRMRSALDSCHNLPPGSRPLLVSHGIALSCLINTLLGLPAHSERRLRLRNGSLSRVDYQQSLWLADGWIVESTGDVAHFSPISGH